MTLVSAGLSHEICSRSVDRALHENIDYNDVLRENTGTWVDDSFTFPNAFYWEDMRVAADDDQT